MVLNGVIEKLSGVNTLSLIKTTMGHYSFYFTARVTIMIDYRYTLAISCRQKHLRRNIRG